MRHRTRQQEKPVFEAGDRFRLTQTIEAFGGEAGETGFFICRAGSKGTVVEKGIWAENIKDPECPSLYHYLRFDDYPGRMVIWVNPLAEVAAKAVEGI